MTRRRRIFPEALERKKPPDGREVVETRTPKSLHRPPSAAPLASSPTAPKSLTQIRRHARSGKGETLPEDLGIPRSEGAGKAPRISTELRRERKDQPAPKHQQHHPSMAPPAGEPTHPTLCTHTRTEIPRPPAAGAAGGGRGISWIDGGRGGSAGGEKIASLYCSGREETSEARLLRHEYAVHVRQS